MEIVKRDEDKQPWLVTLYAFFVELGYGFTIGLASNAIALLCSLFWFLPGREDFLMPPLLILNIIVVSVLEGLQAIGLICCLVDLCRRHTYQNWIRIVLIPIGVMLNFTPFYVYIIIVGRQGGIL